MGGRKQKRGEKKRNLRYDDGEPRLSRKTFAFAKSNKTPTLKKSCGVAQAEGGLVKLGLESGQSFFLQCVSVSRPSFLAHKIMVITTYRSAAQP